MQALTIGFPTVSLQCLKAALLGAATPSDATNTGTNIPNANATIFLEFIVTSQMRGLCNR
jgi:hypothetical protein